ncbi:ATP-binding cassette domain-containing protein [Corynebacterium sp. zg912]|uniref:Energy-coupling factor ABC transporter ATP-binding protein n=1 Tax=Corynebacterium wankanglinii TaxID=2735136 RepID=A0A7H0K8S0_9CORY|nr:MULTISPECIES: energy-coupling factor ABC transporter ATP-binding protein [Corynebacterium]MBA1837114.1 energy-coupling factor ABC transporter ATP-binding protein [Corynebacterium wankanglinii]MCR5928089.1 ATP-binding cassette domain-containing protein [Corynebacterium sp. zg912]QNP93686.1 energy-coupling factor ABC transporter ATP-binding protein [Corynebacterium wankanglinii]
MPAIEFRDAAVNYDGEQVLAPLNVSLTEQRIGVIGSNGSGKSTTVRLINGLIEPTSGLVLYDGLTPEKHGKEIRKRVGFVFSDAESQIVMPRVADDVAFSLRRFKLPRDEVKRRVAEVLERFELTDRAEHSPHTLSGGEKQMLALASVLVIEPDTIIADEPTTLLDLRNRRRIVRELMALDQQLIVVTHDLEMLCDFDRVLVIDDGQLVYDGAPGEAIAFYTDLMDAKP